MDPDGVHPRRGGPWEGTTTGYLSGTWSARRAQGRVGVVNTLPRRHGAEPGDAGSTRWGQRVAGRSWFCHTMFLFGGETGELTG